MSRIIVLVAHDAAPSRAFVRLKQELEARGHRTVAYLGDGGPLGASVEQIGEKVAEADLLVLGMSASGDAAREEIFAGRVALEAGIPFGFFGDRYLCHERARPGKWFEGLREKTAFFFAINAEEAEAAREVFPQARLVPAGNPPWEDFAFPEKTREEVRLLLGVAPDETMILCPGGKDLIVNAMLFGAVVEAVHSEYLKHFRPKVFIGPHPGDDHFYWDREDPQKSSLYTRDPQHYARLSEGGRVPVTVVPKERMPSGTLVVGADIVADQMSSVGIQAAHLRIPVVSFETELILRIWERESGSRVWPPCALGAQEVVHGDWPGLAMAMACLLTNEGFAPMRKRQEKVYPTSPAKGESVRRMADTIEEILQQ